MEFKQIRTLWPEKKGFYIERKNTGDEYIFLHFLTPVELLLDNRWQKVEPGGCILYDKYSHQCFSSTHSELIHDWFHMSGDFTGCMKEYGLEFNRIYYPAGSEFITFILQSIEIEYLNRNKYYREVSGAKLEELFAKIARYSNQSVSDGIIDRETRNRFIALRARIHREFARDWRVEEMALIVNLSPSRFYNIYKQVFGISPKKDLINTRLERVKLLLQQNRYTIEQIAELSGYGSHFHLIRQFKENVGITPGRYIKTLGIK